MGKVSCAIPVDPKSYHKHSSKEKEGYFTSWPCELGGRDGSDVATNWGIQPPESLALISGRKPNL